MPTMTASRLKTFNQCQRLEDLRYRQGWRPTFEADALRFGTLIHATLETWWYTGGDIDATMLSFDKNLRAHSGDPFLDDVRGTHVIRAYARRWTADLSLYEVLALEKPFKAPLVNPKTMRKVSKWDLQGKTDAILRRHSDGRVLVREFKTTTSDIVSDASDYWLRLAMDVQLSTYVIGAESLGYEPAESLYDVVRVPDLRPKKATPEEVRKYTKDGKLYANQRDADETVDEYGARCAEALTDDCFRRREIPRLNSEIEAFLLDATAATKQIDASSKAGYSIRNPDACHKWGRACEFFAHCSAGMKLEDDPGIHQIEDVHPELKEDHESQANSGS